MVCLKLPGATEVNCNRDVDSTISDDEIFQQLGRVYADRSERRSIVARTLLKGHIRTLRESGKPQERGDTTETSPARDGVHNLLHKV